MVSSCFLSGASEGESGKSENSGNAGTYCCFCERHIHGIKGNKKTGREQAEGTKEHNRSKKTSEQENPKCCNSKKGKQNNINQVLYDDFPPEEGVELGLRPE